MLFTRNRELIETAKELSRDLRKNATEGEKRLWEAVRNRRFLGKNFLRQHPIFFEYLDNQAFFIADLYYHERRLVIEIDGGIHEYQKEYDALRTDAINTLDIRVVRFKNEEIENDLHGVLERLKRALTDSRFPT